MQTLLKAIEFLRRSWQQGRIQSQFEGVLKQLRAWVPAEIALWILGSRWLIFCCAYLGTQIRLNQLPPPDAFWLAWIRWDALHYLSIAQQGYPTAGSENFLIVFFPFYPLLIALMQELGVSATYAALWISNCGSAVGLVLIYHLARLDLKESVARRAVALLCLFPTAYFWVAPYTEGLFLALSVGSVLAARHRRWWLAGILGYLASITRITGVLLLAILLWEWGKNAERRWQDLAWLGLVPCGLFTYLALNLALFGNPLQFLTIQREKFYRSFQDPLRAIYFTLRNTIFPILIDSGYRDGNGLVLFSDAVSAILGYVTVAVAFWRGFSRPYLLFTLLSLFTFTTSQNLISVTRYLLSAFPLFLIWAGWLEDHLLRRMVYLGSIGVLVYFAGLFSVGSWAH